MKNMRCKDLRKLGGSGTNALGVGVNLGGCYCLGEEIG